MENKVEQVRVLNEKVALRRLYYSHPLVILKNQSQLENFLPGGDFKGSKELLKTTPLLPRRSKTSVTRSFSDGAFYSKNKNNSCNTLSLSFNSNVVMRDEYALLSGYHASKMMSYAGTRSNGRSGVCSAPVYKSRRSDGRMLTRKGKPALITAMQISTCGMNSCGTDLVENHEEKPIIFVRKEGLSENEPCAMMFQQWGIRKCKKSEQNVSKHRNNWIDAKPDAEVWPKSVHIFNYKSTNKEKNHRKQALYSAKELRTPPLPPNPSPTFGRSTSSCSKDHEKKSQHEDQQQKIRKECVGNVEAGLKFEIIISPPADEWEKEIENEREDEMDQKCLSPSVDDFVYRDYETHPSKTFNSATERMLQQIRMRPSSRGSLVLEDIAESVEEEEELEDNLSTKL